MADDDVGRALHQDRRARGGATIVGDQDAAAGCCLPGNRDEWIRNVQGTIGKDENTADAEHAGPWDVIIDAGPERAGGRLPPCIERIVETSDGNHFAATPAQSALAVALGTRECGCRCRFPTD
jgi:hypothetical protein